MAQRIVTPWSEVNSSETTVSIDPTALVDWGPEYARRATLAVLGGHVMTNNRTKVDVLARIDEERQLWQALVAEVGEQRMEQPGPMGEWSRFEGRALADVEFFEHLHEEHEPSVRDWLERTRSDL
jgi:hypothetical protein